MNEPHSAASIVPDDPQSDTDKLLDEQALQLHMQGKTYREIAALMQISVGGAWKRVKRCLATQRELHPLDQTDIRDECLRALRRALPPLVDDAALGDLPTTRLLNQLSNTVIRLYKMRETEPRKAKRADRKLQFTILTGDERFQPQIQQQSEPQCEQKCEQAVNSTQQVLVEQQVAENNPEIVAHAPPPAVAAAPVALHQVDVETYSKTVAPVNWNPIIAVLVLINALLIGVSIGRVDARTHAVPPPLRIVPNDSVGASTQLTELSGSRPKKIYRSRTRESSGAAENRSLTTSAPGMLFPACCLSSPQKALAGQVSEPPWWAGSGTPRPDKNLASASG